MSQPPLPLPLLAAEACDALPGWSGNWPCGGGLGPGVGGAAGAAPRFAAGPPPKCRLAAPIVPGPMPTVNRLGLRKELGSVARKRWWRRTD